MREIVNAKGWNDTTNNYSVSGPVTVAENCFAYMATNVGDTIVSVNGKKLFPSTTPATIVGDSVTMSDPLGKLYKGQLKIEFAFPGGAAPNVEIVQMYYLTDESIHN